MGRFLAKVGSTPDLVIASSAVRAMKTAKRAVAGGGWNFPIEVTDELYTASSHDVLQILVRLDPVVKRVMLVGHNPTWEETTSYLIGGGSVRFPTAAIACIRFTAGTWEEVGGGRGTLRWFVTPKLLAAAGI
jgi:phosphohistidine phosphatase